ncbi:MAG TPA: hypothetical protein VFO98_05710 [Marmoricola sp.]|nr:hypothetical protein [Marmoricola sp.]
MTHFLVSVPVVVALAAAAVVLLTRDMVAREMVRDAGPTLSDPGTDPLPAVNPRDRWLGLLCTVVFVALVVLRFVTLAG